MTYFNMYILLKNEDLKFAVGLLPTPFSVKRKSLFVFRILDGLEIALGQSETLLHCRHVRIYVFYELTAYCFEHSCCIQTEQVAFSPGLEVVNIAEIGHNI